LQWSGGQFRLGNTFELTPAEARKMARIALSRVRLGSDPGLFRTVSRASGSLATFISRHVMIVLSSTIIA
jgi:hypothetical protein